MKQKNDACPCCDGVDRPPHGVKGLKPTPECNVGWCEYCHDNCHVGNIGSTDCSPELDGFDSWYWVRTRRPISQEERQRRYFRVVDDRTVCTVCEKSTTSDKVEMYLEEEAGYIAICVLCAKIIGKIAREIQPL